MKKKKTYKYCEFCDEAYLDVSPPSKDQYEQGLIEVKGISVLLPEEISGRKKTCAMNADGVFCDVECLYQYIKNMLQPIKTKKS